MNTQTVLKRVLWGVFAVFMIVCTFIGVNGIIKTAKADEPEVFQMENSASIRLNGNGLRFKVKMNAAVKDSINFDDVNLYFIVMPEKYLSIVNGDYQMAIARTPSGEFDISRSHCLYIRVNNNIYFGKDGYYYANGGVSNVQAANLKESFVAIACIETNTAGEYSYRYADLPSGKTNYPATHLYNVVNKSMLYSSENYYSDIVDNYGWYGGENYPVTIDTQAQFNEFASKANGGCDFDSFNVDVMTDLEFTDGGAAAMTTMDADLDLNGHTITYTSTRTDLYPLISSLSGTIKNGKIVASSAGGQYTTTGMLVAGGTGLIENVEFDISFNGWIDYNTGWIFVFDTTISFDKVVINATNTVSCTQVGLFHYDFSAPATVFNNTIIISNIEFGTYGSWGVGATSIGADANATNSGMFASAAAVSGIDYSAFDDSIWKIDPVTGVPMMVEVEEISSLAGISGVAGKYYKLTTDLNLTDNGAAQVATLDSILDLNGHTITYTSARSDMYPLIGTLNGAIVNGKIVANSTVNGLYSTTGYIVASLGSGTVKNVEFDISFTGWLEYNVGWALAFPTTLNFDTVVIKATNSVNSTYVGLFCYSFDTPATVFKNTIIISNIEFGTYGSWGVEATSIAADANATNSGFFASAGAVEGIDFTKFDSDVWQFDPITGIPTM